MTYKKFFISIVLILIGIILLANNIGWINISWHDIWYLWPILFILWGIAVIPIKDIYKILSSIVIVIAAILITIYYKPTNNHRWFNNFKSNWDYDDDDDDDKDDDDYQSSYNLSDTISDVYNSKIACDDYNNEKKVELYMAMPTGKYTINSNPDNSKLICIERNNENINYSLISENKSLDNKKITFSLPKGVYKKVDSTFYFNFKLNQATTWDFDIDGGVANITINGKNLKISDIKINEGVASTQLTLGKLNDTVNISINSGISNISIDIPKDSYCEINSDGIFNTKSLNNFTRINKGKFVYNKEITNPSCRIYMNLKIALSSFNINTY